MSDMVTTEPPVLGLFARIAGIIFSPTATFKSVVAAPRSVGVLFIVCLVMGLAAGGPQFTDAGKQAALDMQVRQIEQFSGQPVTPEMYTQMEARAGYGAYVSIASMFVVIPVMTLVFSLVYWAIFNIVLGGTATVKEVLAVTAHASVIGALGALVALPIQLMQGTFSPYGPFNLGVLVPMLEPTNRLAMFLGGVTVFGIWQAIVTGLGLATLYKRSPAGIVVAMLLIFLAITAFFTVGISLAMGR